MTVEQWAALAMALLTALGNVIAAFVNRSTANANERAVNRVFDGIKDNNRLLGDLVSRTQHQMTRLIDMLGDALKEGRGT